MLSMKDLLITSILTKESHLEELKNILRSWEEYNENPDCYEDEDEDTSVQLTISGEKFKVLETVIDMLEKNGNVTINAEVHNIIYRTK